MFMAMFILNWSGWKTYDTIHTLVNHREYLDDKTPSIKEFDEKNILAYNFTYGEMCRVILRRVNS